MQWGTLQLKKTTPPAGTIAGSPGHCNIGCRIWSPAFLFGNFVLFLFSSVVKSALPVQQNFTHLSWEAKGQHFGNLLLKILPFRMVASLMMVCTWCRNGSLGANC